MQVGITQKSWTQFASLNCAHTGDFAHIMMHIHFNFLLWFPGREGLYENIL
jgi:hypothetical protein